jgi:hypothetical protein
MIKNNKIWYEMHRACDVDISFVSRILKNNLQTIKNNGNKWQWVFLVMFILPIISMLLLFVSSLFDARIVIIIENEWVFWIYCVHYSVVGLFAFFRTCSISISNFEIELFSNDLTHTIKFSDDRSKVENYQRYIEKCYYGFTIFGIPMKMSKLSSFAVLLIAVISWLFDYIIG